MRTIAITKKCTEYERNLILSSVEKEDMVLFFDNEKELLESENIEDIEIILGEPELSTVHSMKNLRWIQMTWAGVNIYTSTQDFPENVVLTNASGAYGCVISEYIVSGILALVKNIFPYRAQMQAGGWSKIEGEDTIEGKRALILGTGNIGEETAKRLKCFSCETVGICRTQGKKVPFFDEMYTIENLDEQLPYADMVIIALPGTAKTAGMFDADRISKMKVDAILVNVGRGFIVNTDDLIEALQSGCLRGAVIDVTDPEPLPENHPLRNMENVILTPHISGVSWGDNTFTKRRIMEIFWENLKRDSKNEPKRNVVDFRKGY